MTRQTANAVKAGRVRFSAEFTISFGEPESLVLSEKRGRTPSRKADKEPTEFYTLAQIARFLRIDQQTLYRFAEEGRPYHFRFDGELRFHGNKVEGFTRKRRIASGEGS